jgi:hypothetical protein
MPRPVRIEGLHLVVVDKDAGSRIGIRGRPGYHRGTMSRRRQLRDIIAQLEDQRTRLDGVRERARRQRGPNGKRLEAQATARLREIEQRIADLRASLE